MSVSHIGRPAHAKPVPYSEPIDRSIRHTQKGTGLGRSVLTSKTLPLLGWTLGNDLPALDRTTKECVWFLSPDPVNGPVPPLPQYHHNANCTSDCFHRRICFEGRAVPKVADKLNIRSTPRNLSHVQQLWTNGRCRGAITAWASSYPPMANGLHLEVYFREV
jgi:hypothetical protein